MKREDAKPNLHRKARRGNGARAGSGTYAADGDYTAAILHFLESAHGKTRIDDKGDYYYNNVSAVSLHFLLNADLPGREVLWQWYQYFDRSRSESIYRTDCRIRDWRNEKRTCQMSGVVLHVIDSWQLADLHIKSIRKRLFNL